MKPKTQAIVPVERIESRILLVRGHKVMLDSDLAQLYGVTTKRLNEQVKRNRDRFPADFMFRLRVK
jgi:ORF6N domain